jgi:hypothetical protein
MAAEEEEIDRARDEAEDYFGKRTYNHAVFVFSSRC